jgi:hypothetical protein
VNDRDRKFVEKRLLVFEDMAPRLNDLLCFFRRVGNFRAIMPPVAVARKRELDETFHVNEFLFSEAFRKRYHAFMEGCFRTWTAVAEDAKLRASAEAHRAERGPDWSDEWFILFVAPHHVTPVAEVVAMYEALMMQFAEELGATDRR